MDGRVSKTDTGWVVEDSGCRVVLDRFAEGFHAHSLTSDGSDPSALQRLVSTVLRLTKGSDLYLNDSGSDPRMLPYYERLGFKKAYTVYKRDGIRQ